MNLPIDEMVDEDLTEKIEKMYETTMFQKGVVNMVNVYFFYCVNQSLEQYTKVVLPLKLGSLSKDELLSTILKYRLHDGRRFNVTGIYDYHFNPDLIEFLKEDECPLKEHQVETIKFDPSIELFHHHTSIFILLNNEKTRHTKKMHESKESTSKRKTNKII